MHAKLLVKLVLNRPRVHWKHVNYVSQPDSDWLLSRKDICFDSLYQNTIDENSLREDGVSECLDLKFTAVQLLLLCTEQKILSVEKV